jgi:hypothetical protein
VNDTFFDVLPAPQKYCKTTKIKEILPGFSL